MTLSERLRQKAIEQQRIKDARQSATCAAKAVPLPTSGTVEQIITWHDPRSVSARMTTPPTDERDQERHAQTAGELILEALAGIGRPTTIGVIADRAELNQSTVSEAIKTLIRHGRVEAKPLALGRKKPLLYQVVKRGKHSR